MLFLLEGVPGMENQERTWRNSRHLFTEKGKTLTAMAHRTPDGQKTSVVGLSFSERRIVR